MTFEMTLWVLFHLTVGLFGTWCARRYALRANLLDQPGARRSHDAPTPRGGGVAIVIALLIATIWLGTTFPERRLWSSCFAIGLAVVAGIGWFDDHRPLSAWLRLAVHLLAAAVLAWGTQQTFGNPWLTAGALLLGVGLTNAWNFMDGIDGIAAGQAAIIAVAITIAAAGTEQWLAVALAAACAGFLPMNFPKAKIFLGDVGSGALGFTLAALLTGITAKQSALDGLLVLLPLAPFLVDTVLTLASRVIRGEQWWTAHVGHTFQIWARRVRSHRPVTLAYCVWAALGSALWLALRGRDFGFITLSLTAWYMATITIWFYLRRPRDGANKGLRNDFQT